MTNDSNLNIVDELDDVSNNESVVIKPKNAFRCRRINKQILQSLRLIWLDSSIDESNSDFCKTMVQLRGVVNTIDTFTDTDQCVDFLTDLENENVCMIISDALCQKMMPLIHDANRLHSVFILCDNKITDQTWVKSWYKIKKVFTEISVLCDDLKQVVNQCEQNAISISFINTNDNIYRENLDRIDPEFMYTQILKEILLSITFDQNHIKHFIDYCYEQFAENDPELNKIKQLECGYRDKTPVWWYTCEQFFYTMLNRALRHMDTETIIKMGFFIKDLHHHLEQLHQTQFSDKNFADCVIVYRGQGMFKTEFEHIKKNKGGLLVFNNFLSTSKDRDVALCFAESNLDNPHMIGIFFVMTIDASQSTTPFASIQNESQYEEENEVLFGMQTVFRLVNITSIDGNPRLFRVELTLTSDNDEDLCQLTNFIREEVYPNAPGWYRLGDILYRMGQSQQAEHIYQNLLEQTTDEIEKAAIYYQLALAKKEQAEYEEAITLCEKAVNISKIYCPSNKFNLASASNLIGLVHEEMGEYSQALPYYEKSLQIQEQLLPPNHRYLAGLYNNIGMVYANLNEYSKACSYCEKSLAIQQEALPPNHPALASSYTNIGIIYRDMGEYLKALSFFEKSLEIKQKSLPLNHPDIGASYNNIAGIYRDRGQYFEGLPYAEKALEIQQQLLPPNHPVIAYSYHNIAETCCSIGEYPKSLLYYRKSLEMQQQVFSPNHPILASTYNSIGMVYFNMNEYPEALLFFEKSLDIQQQSLPPYHSHLAGSYNNVGMVHYRMREYLKADWYYEKALEILQHLLPPNHPDLASSYSNIAGLYYDMGEYDKALLYSEKAIEIREQLLPPNHPNLASSYDNMALLYTSLGDYSKALLFAERAVNIAQQSLTVNHPNFQKWKKNLEQIKKNL